MRSLPSNSPPAYENPYPANLDGGSQWEYFHPVRPGDRITVTTMLADLFERPGRLGNMLFSVRETKYVNQFGQTVALQRTTGDKLRAVEVWQSVSSSVFQSVGYGDWEIGGVRY